MANITNRGSDPSGEISAPSAMFAARLDLAGGDILSATANVDTIEDGVVFAHGYIERITSEGASPDVAPRLALSRIFGHIANQCQDDQDLLNSRRALWYEVNDYFTLRERLAQSGIGWERVSKAVGLSEQVDLRLLEGV